MKTRKLTCIGTILLAIAMLCAAGCTKPDNGGNEGGGDNTGTGGGTPNPNGGGAGCPKVETMAVTDITSNSAKSGGIITDNGDGRILEQGICWSTSGTPVVDNTHATATVGETSFTCTMSNLSPSTTYYVCAYAINTAGVGYGDVHHFTTVSNGGGGGGGGNNSNLPVVTTTEVTQIKHNSARCGGNVTADGGSTVTARGICWSRHSGTTLDDNIIRIGSGLGEFSIIVTDLNPTTTYYVRAYATNSTGTNYGEEYSFTTTETPAPAPPAPEGAIDGLFSVSPTKQVWFSQGNLQYQASTGTWRFATNSYDYVGGMGTGTSGNSINQLGTVSGSSNNNISPTYSGWIDLFGWGTSGWNNGNQYFQPFDWQAATNAEDRGYGYGPTEGINFDYDLTAIYAQSDWGVHNAISNGGNQAGLWRTLTVDEWDYLLNERSASTVNGVDDARVVPLVSITIASKTIRGNLLIPDNYTHPEGIEPFHRIDGTAGIINNSGTVYNEYTVADLRALQQAGCVFLPMDGLRSVSNGNVTYYGVASGGYWSSSAYINYDSYGVAHYGYAYFYKIGGMNRVDGRQKFTGLYVRLVQDRQ